MGNLFPDGNFAFPMGTIDFPIETLAFPIGRSLKVHLTFGVI